MSVQYVQPKAMHHNPAFTQAIIIPANARTLIIGGQNAVDADGQIVGKNDIGAQAAKAIDNLMLVLAEAGAGLEHLVKVSIFMVGVADLRPAFGAWTARWGNRPNPPTVSMLRVVGLGNPDFMIEIEALAVLP